MKSASKENNHFISQGRVLYSDELLHNLSYIDYGAVLKELNISFVESRGLLIVGAEIPLVGWVLHISIIKSNTILLLDLLLPELDKRKSTFTLPQNSDIQNLILDGGWGNGAIGKVISIYLTKDDNAAELANQLIKLTKPFAGPDVPAGFHLGECVFASFVPAGGRSTDWPFDPIVKPSKRKSNKIINKYLIIDQLKADAKGGVYKCLNLKKLLNIHWCILKEGNYNHCADDAGRTIRERLQWQFDLATELSGLIPIPKPLDYFETDGKANLVIEFIKGVNLFEYTTSIQQGMTWPSLDLEAKRKILKVILETVKSIEKFHVNGVIHRDINPGNFMINAEGKITVLDTELAYNYHKNQPLPPFTYGTNGYISPQQRHLESPSTADDIFGLGSLIFKLMTGISPGKLNYINDDRFFKNMRFLIGNSSVAAMLTSCRNVESESRPPLQSVIHTLEVYTALLLTNSSNIEELNKENEVFPVKQLIQRCLNSLIIKEYRDQSGCWMVKSTLADQIIANEFQFYNAESGLARGVSGVLYVIALAEKMNFYTGALDECILINYKMAAEGDSAKQCSTGLFNGSAGIAIALNKLVETGLLENNIQNNDLIYQNIHQQSIGNNLAGGSSGVGLAYLISSSNKKLPGFYDELSLIVRDLINTQNKDGSWWIKQDGAPEKGIKLYGFSYGIAGITYFLLTYLLTYDDELVKKSIVSSLNFLLKVRKVVTGVLLWPISAINETIDPWIDHGFTGIALLFIRAYTIFGDPVYKQAAVDALTHHPKFITSNYLTVANGIAGLGEVYLEAYKAFKDNEWLERASHIVQMLANCYWENPDGSVYWLDSNDSRPAADYMAGNSGILHFLLHYYNPDKIEFPLQ